MKEAMNWIQRVLEELIKVFPDNDTKPNITLPQDSKDVIFLIFHFAAKDKSNVKKWFGFGITEEDLLLDPVDLVAQVKKDLKL